MSADPPAELRPTLDAAYTAWDAGDLDTAAAKLTDAVLLPGGDRHDYWFDLSLVHKLRRDWPETKRAALRAVDHGTDPTGDPTWWNLGIAATALRDWSLAGKAWRGYGVDISEDDGADPIELDLGLTPIRLRHRAGTEVAWATRLCPARARLLSVPLPASGRRWGEVVVHDGVPNGDRTWNGQRYPVFDELELFEPSPTPTFTVRVAASADDVTALVERVIHAGWGAEAGVNVRLLCASCADGPVAGNHDHPRLGDGVLLVAAPEEVVTGALAEWRAIDSANRSYGGVQHAL